MAEEISSSSRLRNTEAWIWLNLIPGLLPHHHVKLLKAYHTPQEILEASEASLVEVGGFEKEFSASFMKKKSEVKGRAERESKLAGQMKVTLLTLFDEAYPSLLKQIFDPPIVLYVMGQWKAQDGQGVAMVGSRKATPYGRFMAERLAGETAEAGVTVVSGMARGIDTAVHEAALKAKGRTVAVLGSGLARCYPAENKQLMERIASTGAVVSEFPLEEGPQPQYFPRRNRVISGLAYGTVVIEAAKGSGALITADFALEQGREVFAVPGAVGTVSSEGTNGLIKQGAKLVETAQEILSELSQIAGFPTVAAVKGRAKRRTDLLPQAQEVLDLVPEAPEHIDLIIRRSRLPVSVVMAQLVELELSGLVKQFSGKLFARTIS